MEWGILTSDRLQLHEGGRGSAAEHLVLRDSNMGTPVGPHLYHFPIVHPVTRGQRHLKPEKSRHDSQDRTETHASGSTHYLVVLLLALHFLLHDGDVHDSCRGQGDTHSDGPGGDNTDCCLSHKNQEGAAGSWGLKTSPWTIFTTIFAASCLCKRALEWVTELWL